MWVRALWSFYLCGSELSDPSIYVGQSSLVLLFMWVRALWSFYLFMWFRALSFWLCGLELSDPSTPLVGPELSDPIVVCQSSLMFLFITSIFIF